MVAVAKKSKVIASIEQKLGEIDPRSPRGEVLESARLFKTNWLDLGKKLATVHDGNLWQTWGYPSFDKYISAELHLRRDTAMKLLRSYTFVREAKPDYLAPENVHSLPPINVVDFLSRQSSQLASQLASQSARQDGEPNIEPSALQSFTNTAFEQTWSPRTVSAKWRDLVGEQRREVIDRDPASRALARAKELCERLQKTLIEIPGLDTRALDALAEVHEALHANDTSEKDTFDE